MENNYMNTWNSELRQYYRRSWDSETIDKYRNRMEKMYDRIKKYMTKYKTKKCIFEYGCFNMDIVNVELSELYVLNIKLGDGKNIRLNLETVIDYNVNMRYDVKCNSVYFTNIY